MSHPLATRARDRWSTFSAAPHRLFFATGITWLLAWSAWWTALLGARLGGIQVLEPGVPALLVHGGAMLFAVFTPFMYGFLWTVFPRWMPAPEISRGVTLLVFWLLNLGQVLALAGLLVSTRLHAAGWLLLATSMLAAFGLLARSLARASSGVPHAFVALAGLAAGVAGAALFTVALLRWDFSAWPLVRALGLWAFLLVVYFAVCHRMLPFFTSRVVPGYVRWQPAWVLYGFAALGLARALLEPFAALRWLATLPLAGIALLCALKWWPGQRMENRLMACLHYAFGWLAGGLVLAAAADLGTALGIDWVPARAGMHMLGMGFIGSMLVAMVTRVTLGHSGRPLMLDAWDWRIFLGLQFAVALRVAGEFLPGATLGLSGTGALLWTLCLGAWAARRLPVYFRPRVDGAPG
ncbi:NnrS family protein [Thioalkalivibrio sp. XN279]|uniref:NnrS family protein n=1 Tax=Thioalkalivibrio sp. XN279 TaxID=2714953 RepID=UPI00140E836D|nr:NnrS family protein [Thioalkalivibrio sp. XN279]NHA15005.1 NnrS family protein [Thioalkalivibrio sp. XN279]